MMPSALNAKISLRSSKRKLQDSAQCACCYEIHVKILKHKQVATGETWEGEWAGLSD